MTSALLICWLWAFNQYQIEIAPINPQCELNDPLCGIDIDQALNYQIAKSK